MEKESSKKSEEKEHKSYSKPTKESNSSYRGSSRGGRGSHRGSARGGKYQYPKEEGYSTSKPTYKQNTKDSSQYYNDYYGDYYGGYYDYYSESTDYSGNYQKNQNQFNYKKDQKSYDQNKPHKTYPKEEKKLEPVEKASLSKTSFNLEDLIKEDKTKSYFESLTHNDDDVHANLAKLTENEQPLKVLMIAEKPSVAKSIAKALSGKKAIPKKDSDESTTIWSYIGNFKGFPADFKVTSVTGHVFETDFSKEIDTWKLDPVNILELNTERKATDANMVKHLTKVGEWCNIVVLWLDCDNEGENICFEILDLISHFLPTPHNDYVFRAKFSSLVSKDIQTAFDNLNSKPDELKSKSVDARRLLDLKVGVAFTVFQTKTLKYK